MPHSTNCIQGARDEVLRECCYPRALVSVFVFGSSAVETHLTRWSTFSLAVKAETRAAARLEGEAFVSQIPLEASGSLEQSGSGRWAETWPRRPAPPMHATASCDRTFILSRF